MAGTIVVDTIQSSTALPPTIQNTSAVEIGTFCRAWVNFNGTGTIAIRASFNVTSITDNATGDYTVNFTTAMSDANYAVVYKSDAVGTNTSQPLYESLYTTASGSTRIRAGNYGGNVTGYDPTINCVSIFR